ncbi:(2E,6E)-farnesyl diphosphate synthase [hydrothermal vent metagenome]|uniref:(2E,6E)-farnesyl diphosphate synthase n=1 Tax=hydrothermal vent metagenome TaxID=652676 RepID=A0A3B0QQS3_9ZZZZ
MYNGDLSEYMRARAAIINGALEDLLPPEQGHHKNLAAAMRYSVFAGGKRLRPVLVMAAAEAAGSRSAAGNGNAAGNDSTAGSLDFAGGSYGGSLDTACAFECIHTYSLIHDDLPAIDDDDLRRGKPTCHKVYGEATAILAGDALLTLAFNLIAGTKDVAADKLLRVIAELSKGAGYGGMIGGQLVDIESEGREISFPVLEHIHIHKTGALIVAAIRSGAIIGGADDDTLDALTTYGEALGLAFQITDDILDLEGTDEELGKPSGSDLKRKKATYPSLLGISESKRMAADVTEKGLAAIEGLGAEAEPLRDLAGFVIKRRS